MTKNPWAISDRDAFWATVEQFCDEAGGMMRMYLIRHTDARLRAAVINNDPLALTLAASIAGSLRNMETQQRDCMLCRADFGPHEEPLAFVIWLPSTKTEKLGSHQVVITQPICAECFAQSDRHILNEAVINLKNILSCDVIETGENFIDEL